MMSIVLQAGDCADHHHRKAPAQLSSMWTGKKNDSNLNGAAMRNSGAVFPGDRPDTRRAARQVSAFKGGSPPSAARASPGATTIRNRWEANSQAYTPGSAVSHQSMRSNAPGSPDARAVYGEHDVLQRRVAELERLLEAKQNLSSPTHDDSSKAELVHQNQLFARQLESTQATLEEAEATVAQLRHQLQLQTKQTTSVKQMLEELQQAHSGAQQELAEAARRFHALETRLVGSEGLAAQLEAEASAARAQGQLLAKKLEAAEADKNRQVEDLVKVLLKTQAEARERTSELREATADWATREDEWRARLQGQQDQGGSVQQLRAQLQDAQQKARKSDAEKRALAKELAVVQEENSSLQQRLDKVTAKKRGKSAELQAFYEQTQVLIKQMSQLEEERELALAEAQTSAVKLREREDLLQESAVKSRHLLREVETSACEIRDGERRLKEVQSHGARLASVYETQMATKMEEVASTKQRELEETSQALELKTQQMATMLEKEKSLLLELQSARSAESDLKDQLETTEMELHLALGREKTLEGLRGAAATQEEALATQISIMEERETALRSELSDARLQIQRKESELAQSQAEHVQLEATLAEGGAAAGLLREQLGLAESTIQGLRDDLAIEKGKTESAMARSRALSEGIARKDLVLGAAEEETRRLAVQLETRTNFLTQLEAEAAETMEKFALLEERLKTAEADGTETVVLCEKFKKMAAEMSKQVERLQSELSHVDAESSKQLRQLSEAAEKSLTGEQQSKQQLLDASAYVEELNLKVKSAEASEMKAWAELSGLQINAEEMCILLTHAINRGKLLEWDHARLKQHMLMYQKSLLDTQHLALGNHLTAKHQLNYYVSRCEVLQQELDELGGSHPAGLILNSTSRAQTPTEPRGKDLGMATEAKAGPRTRRALQKQMEQVDLDNERSSAAPVAESMQSAAVQLTTLAKTIQNACGGQSEEQLVCPTDKDNQDATRHASTSSAETRLEEVQTSLLLAMRRVQSLSIELGHAQVVVSEHSAGSNTQGQAALRSVEEAACQTSHSQQDTSGQAGTSAVVRSDPRQAELEAQEKKLQSEVHRISVEMIPKMVGELEEARRRAAEDKQLSQEKVSLLVSELESLGEAMDHLSGKLQLSESRARDLRQSLDGAIQKELHQMDQELEMKLGFLAVNGQLEDELLGSRSALTQSEATNQVLIQELDSCASSLDAAEAQRAALLDLVADLEQEWQEVQAEAASAKAQLEATQAPLATSEGAVTEPQRTHSQLTAAVQELEARASGPVAQLMELLQEAKDLAHSRGTQPAEQQQASDDPAAGSTTPIGDAEEGENHVQGQLALARCGVEGSTHASSSSESLASARARAEALEKEVQQARQMSEHTRLLSERAQAAERTYVRERSNLAREVERHQAALSEAHVTILSLEVELEAKTHEAQLSWAQVEVFAQLVAGLEVERTEAEARLDEANSELHTQGQALQTQQDRVAQLQTALDDARLQHRQLTQHLADSRSDTDKQVEELVRAMLEAKQTAHERGQLLEQAACAASQEQDTAGEQLRAAREYAARIHAAMAEVQASTAREVQLAHRDAQAKSRALAESSTKVDALTSALEAAEARQAELVEQLEDAGTQLAASTQKSKRLAKVEQENLELKASMKQVESELREKETRLISHCGREQDKRDERLKSLEQALRESQSREATLSAQMLATAEESRVRQSALREEIVNITMSAERQSAVSLSEIFEAEKCVTRMGEELLSMRRQSESDTESRRAACREAEAYKQELSACLSRQAGVVRKAESLEKALTGKREPFSSMNPFACNEIVQVLQGISQLQESASRALAEEDPFASLNINGQRSRCSRGKQGAALGCGDSPSPINGSDNQVEHLQAKVAQARAEASERAQLLDVTIQDAIEREALLTAQISQANERASAQKEASVAIGRCANECLKVTQRSVSNLEADLMVVGAQLAQLLVQVADEGEDMDMIERTLHRNTMKEYVQQMQASVSTLAQSAIELQVDLSKHRGEVVTAMELDRLVPAHVPRSSCQILNSVEKIIGASPVAHVGEIPTDAASNRGEGSPGVSSGVVATQPQSETRSSKCKLFAWQDGDPRGKMGHPEETTTDQQDSNREGSSVKKPVEQQIEIRRASIDDNDDDLVFLPRPPAIVGAQLLLECSVTTGDDNTFASSNSTQIASCSTTQNSNAVVPKNDQEAAKSATESKDPIGAADARNADKAMNDHAGQLIDQLTKLRGLLSTQGATEGQGHTYTDVRDLRAHLHQLSDELEATYWRRQVADGKAEKNG